MRIFETHTHDYFSQCKEWNLLQEISKKAGVEKKIQIGCDEISSALSIHLAEKNDGHFASVGLHPCDVKCFFQGENRPYKNFDYQPTAQTLESLFIKFCEFIEQSKKVIAIGESGFDAYHDDSKEQEKQQYESFLMHIELCKKYSLPLIIHSRNTDKVLENFFIDHITNTNITGVVHCYSGDKRLARILTQKYDFRLGIGGVITYKNALELQKIVEETPLEFLLTETDSPFLSPQKFRQKNKINDSSSLREVIEKIAEIKNLSIEFTSEKLFTNAEKLFKV